MQLWALLLGVWIFFTSAPRNADLSSDEVKVVITMSERVDTEATEVGVSNETFVSNVQATKISSSVPDLDDYPFVAHSSDDFPTGHVLGSSDYSETVRPYSNPLPSMLVEGGSSVEDSSPDPSDGSHTTAIFPCSGSSLLSEDLYKPVSAVLVSARQSALSYTESESEPQVP